MAARGRGRRRQRRRICRCCGEPFWPDRRARGRQHFCGRKECQRHRHREADRRWHEAHPDYDVDRRLRVLGERLRGCRDPGEVVQQEIEPLCRLPADSVQSEFGLGGLAVLVMLGRLVVRHVQDETTSQALEITEQIGN